MLRAILAALFAASALTGATATTPPAVAQDVELYLEELERIHRNPYHAVPREQYRAAADRLIDRLPQLEDDELYVELLRLVALLGERDGHANASPLDRTHRRARHYYPIATYEFVDGVYVVAAPTRPELVGKRLLAVDGRPLANVLGLVDPLVPSDNPLSLAAHRSPYLASAEILHGLGITASASRATFAVEGAEARLAAVPARRYVASMRRWFPNYVDGMPKRKRPLLVQRRGAGQWVTTLDRGRVVYFVYNTVQDDVFTTADRILRLARRPKTRRVIVDLRNNGGGDIGTYPYLLEALKAPAVDRRGRLVVLIGRTTFSAATHFAVDLDDATRAILIGEPTGGSPNHYSDTDPVALPISGYTINIPRRYYEKQPGRPGLQLEPDIRVRLSGRDFFAGRDPVLQRALSLR